MDFKSTNKARQTDFELMTPAVILISGPSGAGKSTAALAWAEAQSSRTAVVDVDQLRLLVKAGRARPDLRWDADAERQWRLAIHQAALLARSFIEDGISCVVDAYAPPVASEDQLAHELEPLDLRRVYLYPAFDICLARNATRAGEANVNEAALRRNYDDFEWSLRYADSSEILRTDGLSIEDTVREIGARLL